MSADPRLAAGWSALERRDMRSAEELARAELRRDPAQVEFMRLLGASLFMQERFREAIAPFSEVFDKARTSGAGYHLGYCYIAVGDPSRAGEVLEQVVREYPQMASAHNLLGISLVQRSKRAESLACFASAIERSPQFAEAHVNMGSALSQLGRTEEAVDHFRQALALAPDSIDARHHLGFALQELSSHDEAITCLREVCRIDPTHRYALGALLWSQRVACSWEGLESGTALLRDGIRRGLPLAVPFAMLALSQDPPEQLLCARSFCEHDLRPSAPLWRGERYRHDKIRLAYLSGDFREHAVAYCISELIGLHDRSRFEVTGVSYGADDGGPTRAALAKSFDRFVEARNQDEALVAGMLREMEIDIAVDLAGHTRGSRPGILACRPAPVQVEYLGFAGTSGAGFIDYLVADCYVVPDEDRRHYSEQVVCLPDTFMVNPSRRVMAEPAPRRSDAGLPETGFVFCSFNNSFKITPEIFEVWMRLLSNVAGSVLWLARDNASVEANLRAEAARRGVDPGRLVFARFVKRIEEHYARLPLGDLFLDTAYNGHVTTADALWAGLPVLTWEGRCFAGRVAGSLLRAVGLPELIAVDLEQYEAKALALARDRPRLAALRGKLARNRDSAALFDTDRFRRHIESAYVTMWETEQRGESPRSFSVPA